MDAALEHAVAPAIEQRAPAHWSFLRCTGGIGAHLRLDLEAGGEEAAELARLIEARLDEAGKAPVREPLLPRPGAHRQAYGGGSVRLVPVPGDELPGRLHQLSSAIALRALATVRSGRERCAFGLSLMATTAQSGLGREADPELWRDAARGRVGADERGRSLLASLEPRAAALRGELARIARGQRSGGIAAECLQRWGDGCRALDDPAAVRHHAHLTCNRLGVTPLEEALLALVLAGTSSGADAACPRGGGGRAVVALEDVSRRTGDRTALEGVSLEVEEGEVLVLVGPRGAGKSSLLGITAGLRVAAGGTTHVRGRDPREARRAGAATAELAPPDAELPGGCSIRESVELHVRASERDAPGLVDAVLQETGLQDLAPQRLDELGPGIRRRVAIACALVHDPAVLLLDETTAGLTPVDRDEIWQVVGRRRDRGATTIIATTSIQEALCIGDRVGLILDGALAAVGRPSQIAERWFPRRSLRFHVVDKPDRALLEELPEVEDVDIEQRVDHWAVELTTRQPAELLALLRRDPDFAEILHVDEEALAGPFAVRQA